MPTRRPNFGLSFSATSIACSASRIVGPGDHVFLPTAHGREAYAIRRLIQEIGEERSPCFTSSSGMPSPRWMN